MAWRNHGWSPFPKFWTRPQNTLVAECDHELTSGPASGTSFLLIGGFRQICLVFTNLPVLVLHGHVGVFLDSCRAVDDSTRRVDARFARVVHGTFTRQDVVAFTSGLNGAASEIPGYGRLRTALATV